MMANCKSFFGLDDNYFEGKSCINTASEIAAQPMLLKELGKLLLEKKQITDFIKSLEGLKDGDGKIRIILSGAGSSAFIGEALAGFIAKSLKVKCEAIHTTDIVSAPDTVLFESIPTLLVSFARSGNSPESEGAVRYARKKVKNLYEAAIVCDNGSKLYNVTAENEKSLILLMPEGSNDKGFAMTSSVTCMLLAGFAFFNYDKIDEIVKDIYHLSDCLSTNSLYFSELAQKYSKVPFERAVYLASGGFKGLAHEGSLKMLVLTNGRVSTGFDSSVGFRHGPKSIVKDNTMTLHFISSDPFTAKYDVDLLKEVFREKNENTVIAVCGEKQKDIKADEVIVLPENGYGFSRDICLGLNGLVFSQMLAMFKSLSLGVTTDNPSPGGQVNRVVKGVTVYPYEE
jgi:tagatose-6-phosphate ketose/aldose isomerase